MLRVTVASLLFLRRSSQLVYALLAKLSGALSVLLVAETIVAFYLPNCHLDFFFTGRGATDPKNREKPAPDGIC